MSHRKVRPLYRVKGFLPFLPCVAFALMVSLPAGIAQAGDVASAEARGALGMEAAQGEAILGEAPSLSAGENAKTPWVEAALYLLVASLILAAYGLAARKVPWLRPRLRRKS